LAAVDAASALRLHPNDTRRLIRALEVYEKTGRPISQWQQQFDAGQPAERCRVFVLDWPRPALYARIDHRVEAMFADGLVQEVRNLLAQSRPLSKTARQAVGYREVIEHLGGGRPLADTITLVQQHTRQLAKRQLTWFHSLNECRFVSLSDPFDAEAVTDRIVSLAERIPPQGPRGS
jgi:tRNA dimethylallyltransferase